MTALRFNEVRIERLDGVPRGSGFALEGLSADINLVYGPNGAGKSLTGRSLLALVWPLTKPGLERPTITGSWTLADRSWTVEIEAGHPTWRCDGATCDPPGLPPAESRAHHWLGLRELLTDDGPDATATDTFAARIARELLGGFDLDAAARTLEFTSRPKQPKKLRRDYDEERRRFDEAVRVARTLHAESQTLDTLSARAEAAQRADELRRRLERALDHLDAADEVRRLEGELGEFDDALDRLGGDEQDRLDELRTSLRKSEHELAEAEQASQAAERVMAEAGFGDGVVSTEALQAAISDAELIAERDREVRQTAVELQEATRELESRAARLAPSATSEALQSLGTAPSDEMVRYARDLLEHRVMTAQVDVREREVADGERRLEAEASTLAAPGSAERVRRGLDVLSNWLESPPQSAVPAAGWLVSLLVAAGIVAALVVALVVLHGWGWLPVLVIVAILVWLARPRPASGAESTERATYQREYETLGLQRPDAWTADAVQSTWCSLSGTWTELQAHASARQKLARDQANVDDLRREMDAAGERLQRARVELETALGFTIDDERSDWLHVLGEHLGAWQSARSRVDSLSGGMDARQSELQQLLDTFNGRVEQYVERPAEDASGVKGAMEGLRQREQLHRDADGKATVAERDRERAQSELERVGRQIDALLSKLGLTEDRADMLGRWLEELPRFQEVKQHLGEARTRRDTIAADIGEGHPALTHDRARIESDSDAARREAEGLSQLEREIGAIQNRIDGAKAGHHVEDARRGLDEAQAALERALGTAEQQAAGHAVIDWLREEATDRTQPAVLRRASELFQRITHGRYELRVEESPDGPTFAARDTQHEMVKSLDQLSAGERVQLLVSVRLGFLEQEESGVRLPLILDETLGTTDDARAGAIIDAVVEICRAGRQVFYFTAQPDEVGKWRARLDGEAGIDLKVVDLARVRGLAESDGAPLAIDRPVESPVPSPAGDSHEAYGQRLDVPGLDPRRPVGGVHLWHLLDEPDLVYALITRSIRCWGPFESLVASGLIDVDGLDERRIAVTNARAVAIEAAFDAWRIGRGQAVARDVLEASGAVTSTFIDRIADLAASVGGDAREVIDALDRGEVSRWRSSGTETLREYLEEHGYLDEERRLLPEEILHRVLEQVALEHRGVDIGDDWVKRLVDGLPS